SRTGSTCTCSCLSRWPQIVTLDTPGTAIRRGLIFQRASTERSTSERSWLELRPTIIARLVDEVRRPLTAGLPTGRSANARRDRRADDQDPELHAQLDDLTDHAHSSRNSSIGRRRRSSRLPARVDAAIAQTTSPVRLAIQSGGNVSRSGGRVKTGLRTCTNMA